MRRFTVLSVVVLPLPDPPTRATSSPFATESETPSTAFTSPKRTHTPSRAMAGSGIGDELHLGHAGLGCSLERPHAVRERVARLDER